jgi:hypothetical protein
MQTLTHSANLLEGGTSQKVVLSAASAQSTVLRVPGATLNPNLPPPTPGQYVLVTGDVLWFGRQGVNPVAVADIDQVFLANNTYRISVVDGNKIAAIAAGAGNLYITPLG